MIIAVSMTSGLYARSSVSLGANVIFFVLRSWHQPSGYRKHLSQVFATIRSLSLWKQRRENHYSDILWHDAHWYNCLPRTLVSLVRLLLVLLLMRCPVYGKLQFKWDHFDFESIVVLFTQRCFQIAIAIGLLIGNVRDRSTHIQSMLKFYNRLDTPRSLGLR